MPQNNCAYGRHHPHSSRSCYQHVVVIRHHRRPIGLFAVVTAAAASGLCWRTEVWLWLVVASLCGPCFFSRVSVCVCAHVRTVWIVSFVTSRVLSPQRGELYDTAARVEWGRGGRWLVGLLLVGCVLRWQSAYCLLVSNICTRDIQDTRKCTIYSILN